MIKNFIELYYCFFYFCAGNFRCKALRDGKKLFLESQTDYKDFHIEFSIDSLIIFQDSIVGFKRGISFLRKFR